MNGATQSVPTTTKKRFEMDRYELEAVLQAVKLLSKAQKRLEKYGLRILGNLELEGADCEKLAELCLFNCDVSIGFEKQREV